MAEYVERVKVYNMLNSLGGCGADPDRFAFILPSSVRYCFRYSLTVNLSHRPSRPSSRRSWGNSHSKLQKAHRLLLCNMCKQLRRCRCAANLRAFRVGHRRRRYTANRSSVRARCSSISSLSTQKLSTTLTGISSTCFSLIASSKALSHPSAHVSGSAPQPPREFSML